VCAPAPERALRARVTAALGRGSLVHALPGLPGAGAPRTARLTSALGVAIELARAHRAETVVVLPADHVLQLDLRPLVTAHRARGADLTLAATPMAAIAGARSPALGIAENWRVESVVGPGAQRPASRGVEFVWPGELAVHAEALPAVLSALPPAPAASEAEWLGALLSRLHVAAYDVLEAPLPGAALGQGAYWHTPTSVEQYYEAQMDLCTPRPALDLYNPLWPLPAVATGLGPARVTADAAGRPALVVNALLSDGALVHGAVVINAVLGADVAIESGAEVEDSVLLDGCRIGRGARIRRALVGAGAIVPDGQKIGYGEPPARPARLLPSGLTVVPAAPAATIVAAPGAR
jgi:glucose-1-phosphate adenylyltransferase